MPEAGRVRAARAAIVVGLLVWFVAAVDLVRFIRPLPLLDSDPSWPVPRLLLGLFVTGAAASAGGVAAGGFFLFCRHSLGSLAPSPLPLTRLGLLLLAVGALAAGVWLRFAALDRLPPSLWIDDVSLITPALALRGGWRDFADAIRPAPFGVPRPYGSVGVLYLELYRVALHLFGTNVFGVRFLSAAAGAVSLLTVLLLARSLLPRGGGALAALALAGLRWNLLLSHWGWNAIVLAPIVDVAALMLLYARRRESLPWAALAGVAAGLSTHIYLASWVAAAALLGLALWPRESARRKRIRVLLPLLFAAAFACTAAPIFLFREGRLAPYFARASDHNVLREIHYMHSPMPALAAAADSLVAPWFKADPFTHHDLPGRTRLEWILGVPVALALARSLVRPREDLSAFLLSQAGAALAASVAGGHAGVPNSYRFGYLANVSAVAAAGGILWLLALFSSARRRAAAIAALGLVAISGALGARDALLRWPERRETFDGFHGQDTMLARAMLRWRRYGSVRLAPGLVHSSITIQAIVRYELDPDRLEATATSRAGGSRSFRLAPPGVTPGSGERVVERVRDAWGREWGVVLGVRTVRSGYIGDRTVRVHG